MPQRFVFFRRITFLGLVSFVLAISPIAANAQAESPKIAWERDFKAAQKKARQQMKPMLLDFTATWCKPCLAMDQEFWVLDRVIDAVQPFVAVKVDFDSATGVVDRYGITVIPNVVFTDPLGNVIANKRGFSRGNVAALFAILELMPKDFSPLREYYDQIDENDKNGIANMKIADAYRNSKMYQLSNKFYKKALDSDDLKQDPKNRERVAAVLAVNHFLSDEFEAASEAFADYLKMFNEGVNREALLYYAVLNGTKRKKKKEAQKYLDLLTSEFPASKFRERASGAVASM